MMTTVRLDKWLWAARFYRTRVLANKAIQHGKITIDNQKPKPARPISIGTTIQIETPLYEKTITVLVLGEKRQGAAIVQSWYKETAASQQRAKAAQQKQQTERLMYKTAPNPIKKPDKHSRRALKEVKRSRDN